MNDRNLYNIFYENNIMDIIKVILVDKKEISDEFEKEIIQKRFNPFLLNRFLSFIFDTKVNRKVIYILNRYGFSNSEIKDMLYELYIRILPKYENENDIRMGKYIKKKEEYPEWFFDYFKKVVIGSNTVIDRKEIIEIYQKMLEEDEEKVAKIILSSGYDIKEIKKYFPFVDKYIKKNKKESNDDIKELSDIVKKNKVKKISKLF